jgi:ubiquinone/menaquinone biosynthesis C-methylase UbiE
VTRQGWRGWDEYAPFYDWENAQTLGRRDVPFWQRVAARARGRVLELGCGTGRITIPLAKSGVDVVGVDRSHPMLDLARARAARTLRTSRTSRTSGSIAFVRADIRQLPFRDRSVSMVLAPYGVLQSLTRERDLIDTLESIARVAPRGATLGIDLVPDVPNWREYDNQVQLRGRTHDGTHLTLIESVRQDRRRHVTTFQQEYIERRGRRETRHRFALTFRTLTVEQMSNRLERAGFRIETVLGDYRGQPWDERSDVWIILAKKG